MAKWYGIIGYAHSVEKKPGVWADDITDRNYAGDVIRNTSRWSTSADSTNDDLNVSNQISIIADPFAYQNFHSMKYIEFMGTKWKITNVEVQYPRLILTIGGVYNG
jgi:hypothetical protein